MKIFFIAKRIFLKLQYMDKLINKAYNRKYYLKNQDVIQSYYRNKYYELKQLLDYVQNRRQIANRYYHRRGK